MDKELSRRDFNKLVATGAAGAVFAVITDAKAAIPITEKSASSLSVSPRWLPSKEKALRNWHKITLKSIKANKGKSLHPVILKFQKLIADDSIVRMYMTQMIQQVSDKYTHYHPNNLQDFLLQLNAVLTIAPSYIAPGHGEESALVGTPFSAILIWTMDTPL